MRHPALDSSEKPPCYGKHPSIVFEGCSLCAKREGCFRRFSRSGVEVLPVAVTRINITKAGDRRATDALLHGFDDELWGLMRTLAAKYGLRLTTKVRAGQTARAVARDRSKQIVFLIRRLDARRVLLYFRMVDESAALSVGCVPKQTPHSRKEVFCLDLSSRTDNLKSALADRVNQVLAMSYLAGKFTPGRSRKKSP